MGKKEPSQGGASRSQKIFLIIFGLILCLALLEVGLRVGGYIVLFPQNYRNKLSFNNKNTYRILCLGESTTRGQYPSSLEEILNLRHSGLRFSVIDKGRDGTVTSAILNRVESYLGEYHPDMVVAMMGVNDDGNTIFSDAALFLRSFRVYKLMRLLWRNMITNATKMGLYAAHLSGQLVRKNQPGLFDYLPGKQYEGQGNNIENGAALKKELALNPGNDAAYVALGRLYRDQGRLQQAEESFKKSIELNPRNDEAYFWLGQLFRDLWQRQQVDVAQLEQPYQDLWQFRGAEEYIEKT